MPSFRDIHDLLNLSYSDGNIEDKEFMILLELTKSKNLDLPYLTYPCFVNFKMMSFSMKKLSNDECLEEFRFIN